MKNRDQFVNDLKARLDVWNTEAAKWESRAEKARTGVVERFEQRREEARYQLKLLEGASTAAFDDIAKGAEKAWKAAAEAFDQARAHFEARAPKSRA